MDLAEFLTRLDKLEEHVRRSDKPVLIGGDFNGKSPEWFSEISDSRGTAISEMISSLGLIILNRGKSPTFRRGDYGSIIDITFASTSVADAITNWEVLEDETLSDHEYIIMEMNISHNRSSKNTTRSRWNTRKINVDNCIEKIIEIRSRTPRWNDQDVESNAKHLIEILTEVCNAGMSKTSTQRRRKHAYWWNEDIAQLRKE